MTVKRDAANSMATKIAETTSHISITVVQLRRGER